MIKFFDSGLKIEAATPGLSFTPTIVILASFFVDDIPVIILLLNTFLESVIKVPAFDTKEDGQRLIVKLYKELNKPENKAFYKTAMGEEVDSTNQDTMVGVQDNARAILSKKIKGIVADYKVKARNEWLRLPENRELFKRYSANIEIISNETTKATLKNLEKIKNLGN